MTRDVPTYIPTEYSFSGLKDTVAARRQVKRVGHQIDLRGRKSSQFEAVMQVALTVLGSMQEAHQLWINSKIEQITPYFTSNENSEDNGESHNELNPYARIQSAFQSGLVTTITQEYKIDKASDRVSSTGGLESIITGYAFDFYSTLRVCQRSGVNPNTALRIAQFAYHHNPNILISLSADPRYRDLNPSVTERAALSYPKNPEAFLDGFKQSINRLSADPRYRDLNPGVIERAALDFPNNPEAFLDRFKQSIDRLSADPRYGDLNPSVIKRAALGYPNNPEAFLDGFKQSSDRLSADPRYSDLNPSVISSAALGYPKNPEAFLDGFIRNDPILER